MIEPITITPQHIRTWEVYDVFQAIMRAREAITTKKQRNSSGKAVIELTY